MRKNEDAGHSQTGFRSSFPTLTARLLLSLDFNDRPVGSRFAALDQIVSDTFIIGPLLGLPKLLGPLENFEFCVVAKLHEDCQPIGHVYLMGNQIGFFVYPQYWSCGYATEMVSAVCEKLGNAYDLVFLQATTLRSNSASVSVLTKCSFRFSGLTRERSSSGSGREVLVFRKACTPS